MEREKMTIDEALSKIENYLSGIYYGYEEEIIDPIQAQVLYAFLQAKSLKTSIIISEKYSLLGELTKKYIETLVEVRKELENELDLAKVNEKKIENLCLQRSEKLRELKQNIESLKLDIKGLSNEVKHYAYLSNAWRSVIEKILQEWKGQG
ncbi:MAG: hypothetical protein NC921_04035 [Candidatus Omnitrophica bacterium]|nr:hypothetical protein [Candidatus Omnitrophota bacterium]